MSAVIASIIIATATAMCVNVADGLTFIEIINDISLVFRFILAIIVFCTLVVLYGWFVFIPLLFKL